MRPLLLALCVSLASGCADPGTEAPAQKPIPADASGESVPPDRAGNFDAQAWLAALRENGTYPEAGTPEATREAELATELEAALGWKRACDSYVDPETDEVVYDPVDEDALSGARGTLALEPISETEAVVAVTCYFGAYQGSYALVHIDGAQANILRAPALGEDSQPLAQTQATFGEPDFGALAGGTFSTFIKGRGLGDCGEYTTFALPASGGLLEIREVRARDCGDSIPDPLPPPTEWPVVYPSS